MTVLAIDKPADYEGAYKFFKNDATGNNWKVKLEMRQGRDALVETPEDVVLAPGEYSIIVTVSPVDAKGKTLLEDGKPIVIDSHTHTFNLIELSVEDYDPETRIMSIVTERIESGEARIGVMNSIRNLVEGWNNG